MGVFFPVHPPTELDKLDKQKRAELKAAIVQALMFDPDLKKLFEDKLPEVRRLLKDKTLPKLEELLRRG
jgi:hypothetical protein